MRIRNLVVAFSLVSLFLNLIPAQAFSADYEITLKSHRLIGLPDARDAGWDGSGQTIVIIDDGNQIDHPYLKDVVIDGNCTSRAVCGKDFLSPGIKSGGAHKGDGFHGSMVTGIIAGQANSFAPGGIAPKAKVISIDNTDGQGEGLILAMDWILSIQKKYNVVAVSGSIGAPNSSRTRGGDGDCSLDLQLSKKIRELNDSGISMVFAAGNGGSLNKLDFPACMPEVISVGALTSSGEITDYSNISRGITVLAPAEIVSSNGNGGYFIGAGTSSAAPVVAGVVALLKQAKPSATPSQIREALQTTKSRASDFLWANLPVLDIPRAIEAIKTGKFDRVQISNNTTAMPQPAPTVTVTATPEPAPTVTVIYRTITCVKGKLTKKVTAVNPKCPKGYKKSK